MGAVLQDGKAFEGGGEIEGPQPIKAGSIGWSNRWQEISG